MESARRTRRSSPRRTVHRYPLRLSTTSTGTPGTPFSGSARYGLSSLRRRAVSALPFSVIRKDLAFASRASCRSNKDSADKPTPPDRKRVVLGKRVSERVNHGGRPHHKKKKNK